MPIYRLQRQADGETFECDARDNEHAVAEFGRMLGVALTLKEGLAAPGYMMMVMKKEPGWTKAPDIPVW